MTCSLKRCLKLTVSQFSGREEQEGGVKYYRGQITMTVTSNEPTKKTSTTSLYENSLEENKSK